MSTEAGAARTAGNHRAAATGDRYERLRRMIASDECVILDGAIGTELIKITGKQPAEERNTSGV